VYLFKEHGIGIIIRTPTEKKTYLLAWSTIISTRKRPKSCKINQIQLFLKSLPELSHLNY